MKNSTLPDSFCDESERLVNCKQWNFSIYFGGVSHLCVCPTLGIGHKFQTDNFVQVPVPRIFKYYTFRKSNKILQLKVRNNTFLFTDEKFSFSKFHTFFRRKLKLLQYLVSNNSSWDQSEILKSTFRKVKLEIRRSKDQTEIVDCPNVEYKIRRSEDQTEIVDCQNDK